MAHFRELREFVDSAVTLIDTATVIADDLEARGEVDIKTLGRLETAQFALAKVQSDLANNTA